MEVKIREFNVYSEDGSGMHVIEYKSVREIATYDGTRKIYGVSRFITANDEPVHYVEGGYQVPSENKGFYELVE